MDFPTNNTGASSSSERTYDVFLCFRGKDTHYGFTSHLYNVLDASGFYTFMDDEELPRGEDVSRELPKAIENSRISIVVFSENYASSKWCLDELVKILEWKESQQHMVLPIFYNVHAAEVRYQIGIFGEAMDKHEKRYKDKVQGWRKALTKAANLSGWPRSSNEHEYKFIQRIVKEVSSILNHVPLHVDDYPVGVDSHVREINKLLQTALDDVRILGIYGFGGIGKTTIAKAIYNSLVHDFEDHGSFLANVRENSKRESGLVQLQERLLSDILGTKGWKVDIVDRGINLIKKRLHGKKVLLILDDVDQLDQLKKLGVRRDLFGKGSIVIITTRKKHLLTSDHSHDFIKYEVTKLSLEKALQLFSWHAFKRNESKAYYAEVIDRAIGYANGHPLTLKVLGSYLCGKSKPQWETVLDKYKKIQPSDIHEKLKISYDGLDDTEKDIFLDIACFLKGNNTNKVETMLKSCNFYPESGIATLIDRCLITIEYCEFRMHDLLQQMGWEIVRQESREPRKRRRLCFDEYHEDVLEVLGENKELDEIQGIMLDFPKPKELQLSAKVFTRMKRLRVLIVRNAHFCEGLEYFPDELRWLDWDNCPLPFSLNSCSKNLVVLNISRSHSILKEPLNKIFENMAYMNLVNCDFIEKIPDISWMPKLKKLDIGYCKKLVEVHQSVGNHENLISFGMYDCNDLQILPSYLNMKSLGFLTILRCSKLDKFPNILKRMERFKRLYLSETAIKELPSSIEYLTGLEELTLMCCIDDCPKLGKFMMGEGDDRHPMGYNIWSTENSEEIRDPHLNVPNHNFSTLNSMVRKLTLQNCSLSNLDFLTTLSCFHTLEYLDLSENNFVTIPKCIYKFEKLYELRLGSCKLLQEIPMLPPNIRSVYADNCISLNFESRSRLLSEEFHKMKDISIVVPKTEIPKWFNIRSVGSSISFSADSEFFLTTIHMVYVVEGVVEWSTVRNIWVCLGVNGQFIKIYHRDYFKMNSNHLMLKTMAISPFFRNFNWNERGNDIEIEIKSEWPEYMQGVNKSESPEFIIKELGIHVEYPQRYGLGYTISERQNMPAHHEQALINIDTSLGHVDSNDKGKGVLGIPLEMTNVSGGEALGSSLVPYSYTEPSPLAGSEMGHRVSNDIGVLALPMEFWDLTIPTIVSDGESLGSSSVVYPNTEQSSLPGSEMGHIVSNDTGVLALPTEFWDLTIPTIVSGGEALGSSSVAYSNTEHSPLLGSEMGHKVPMEKALDTALGWPYMGVQSTGNDGFDRIVSDEGAFGSLSVAYSNTEHSPLPGSEMDQRVPMETALDTALGVQSTVNDGLDPIVSGGEALSSSSVAYPNTEHSPLAGSEMGHRVSNNTGVFPLPMEFWDLTIPTIVSGGEASGSSSVLYSNTQHSPLAGSEMGHRVPMEPALDTTFGVQSTVNDGFDPIVRDEGAFGSSSVAYSNASNEYSDFVFGWPYVDGFDFGSSSIVDPFAPIRYHDSDFDSNGYPLQKRRNPLDWKNIFPSKNNISMAFFVTLLLLSLMPTCCSSFSSNNGL